MNTKLTKRVFAYMIDILIFIVVISLIGVLIPENANISILNQELTTLNEQLINNQIDASKYLNHLSVVVHDIDLNNIVYSILNSFYILIYFVMIPYFKNGQTLGKYLMKIRIVRNDKELLSLNDLVIRNIIINGLGYMLISLAFIYIIPSEIYFIIVTILGFIQIILVIITIFMILYRKDKCGIHDLITHTSVINIEEVKE